MTSPREFAERIRRDDGPHALWQATPTSPGTVTCLWQYTPETIATARENATALVQGLELMPKGKKPPKKKP